MKTTQTTQTRQIGTCQVCLSRHRLPGGLLADHGYTRGWGENSGTCQGSRRPPLELSRKTSLFCLRRDQDAVQTHEAELEQVGQTTREGAGIRAELRKRREAVQAREQAHAAIDAGTLKIVTFEELQAESRHQVDMRRTIARMEAARRKAETHSLRHPLTGQYLEVVAPQRPEFVVAQAGSSDALVWDLPETRAEIAQDWRSRPVFDILHLQGPRKTMLIGHVQCPDVQDVLDRLNALYAAGDEAGRAACRSEFGAGPDDDILRVAALQRLNALLA